MTEGAQWRDRHEWERVAWAVSWIVRPHVKRMPSIDRMLSFLRVRKPKDGEADIQTPEQARAFAEGIAREHKRKFWTLLNNDFAEKE